MKNWNQEKAQNLQIGDKLFWRHMKYKEYMKKESLDKLYKEVIVKSINNGIIKTNFGSYDIETGKNSFEPCGCKRFCDCYGRLELN